jgi:hypothetical protein
MNDYEVKIFNNVYEVASGLLAAKRFVSTPLVDYTKLPAASLYEMDSSTFRYRQSSTPVENFTLITYQLDVVASAKAECRKIYKAIDERMISLNFSRMSGHYVTYPDNPQIVRYVARYEAVVDADGNLYRR